MRLQQFVAIGTVAAILGAPTLSLQAASPPPRVVINELMWAGSATSASDEWIELRNFEDLPVDLGGWKLTRRTSGSDVPMLTIPAGLSVEAHGFFLISNYSDTSGSSELGIAPDFVDSAVSLVNTGLLVTLLDPAGNLIDTADDGSGAPLAGALTSGTTYASMSRNGLAADGRQTSSWHSASVAQNLRSGSLTRATPRAANENVPPRLPEFAPPTITVGTSVQFDASDISDPDGDPVTCAWDFGHGTIVPGLIAEWTYPQPGSYEVRLECRDNQAASQAILQVTVTSPETVNVIGSVVLTELLPNPVGTDDHEFIELFAPDTAADIGGWKITDTSGTKYIFPDGTVIPARGYLAINRTVSKIALNNDDDAVSLTRRDGTIVETIGFSEANEGAAFALIDGVWQWTIESTPGQPNRFARLNHPPQARISIVTSAGQRRSGQPISFEAGDAEDPDGDAMRLVWDFGDGATAVGSRVEHIYRQPGRVVVRLTARDTDGLSDIDEHAFTVKEPLKGASAPKSNGQVKGAAVVTTITETKSAASSTAVVINGWVSAAPGLLGTNLFYLTEGTAGIAVQVNAGLPKLSVGQAITVRGEKRTRSGEAYILVADQSGVVVGRSEESKTPEPQSTTAEKLDMDMVGQLVSVEGEITELSGSRLAVDDGTGEVAIYIKATTGFKRPSFHSGDRIRVTGIASIGTSGLRVLPRVRDDLQLLAAALAAESKNIEVSAPSRPPVWGYGLVVLTGLAGFFMARYRASRRLTGKPLA